MLNPTLLGVPVTWMGYPKWLQIDGLLGPRVHVGLGFARSYSGLPLGLCLPYHSIGRGGQPHPQSISDGRRQPEAGGSINLDAAVIHTRAMHALRYRQDQIGRNAGGHDRDQKREGGERVHGYRLQRQHNGAQGPPCRSIAGYRPGRVAPC